MFPRPLSRSRGGPASKGTDQEGKGRERKGENRERTGRERRGKERRGRDGRGRKGRRERRKGKREGREGKGCPPNVEFWIRQWKQSLVLTEITESGKLFHVFIIRVVKIFH